jgi:hypothetical protein
MQLLESAADGISCIDPSRDNREQCEQQILESVVRFEIRGPSMEDPNKIIGGGGHGTIRDGRYVVVHNHFAIDLSVFEDEVNGEMASLNLYSANGYLLLRDARPPLFKIVFEDLETLVLDFGVNDKDEGFFDWYRVPSASFKDIHEITLIPGSEVAQVNWDGKVTYIDWVRVHEVITKESVPRLVLENVISKGSSGGGVFWNGKHIANNWMNVGHIDEGGMETFQYSVAVLNSESITMKLFSSSGFSADY